MIGRALKVFEGLHFFFFKEKLCSVLPPRELTPNSIVKLRFLFGVRCWGAYTEKKTFFKKNGPRDCKTTFNGLAVPIPKIHVPYKPQK